jgi:hypothetical protein
LRRLTPANIAKEQTQKKRQKQQPYIHYCGYRAVLFIDKGLTKLRLITPYILITTLLSGISENSNDKKVFK